MTDRDQKWYFRTWSLIASFLVLGPLMLPLVWANPRFNRKTKIIISALIILLTILQGLILVKTMKLLNGYYQKILEIQY
ncbi:MAG: hypothetical protein WC442_04910 [Candidatus Omnitrophota bacterium]